MSTTDCIPFDRASHPHSQYHVTEQNILSDWTRMFCHLTKGLA